MVYMEPVAHSGEPRGVRSRRLSTMRLDYGRHAPWVIASLLVVGCPDDDPPTGEGNGSSSTGTMESSTGGSSVMMADSTTGELEGGGSSSEGSSSTGLPTEVTLRGNIQDYFPPAQPIPDAAISVLGQPGLMTVSDENGDFEMMSLATGTFDRFVVADSDQFWGAVVPFTTEYEDIDEFELSQVSLQVIDIQIGVLQEQDPTVMVEPDTAVLLVAIEQNTATGAVVELDPPPDDTTFYAPDANGQPILGANVAQWSAYPVVVFFNLPPGPEGEYEITVTHPERECTPDDAEPPTFGRHVNLIRVDCPPPN